LALRRCSLPLTREITLCHCHSTVMVLLHISFMVSSTTSIIATNE
jgi:hypothetical protein